AFLLGNLTTRSGGAWPPPTLSGERERLGVAIARRVANEHRIGSCRAAEGDRRLDERGRSEGRRLWHAVEHNGRVEREVVTVHAKGDRGSRGSRWRHGGDVWHHRRSAEPGLERTAIVVVVDDAVAGPGEVNFSLGRRRLRHGRSPRNGLRPGDDA